MASQTTIIACVAAFFACSLSLVRPDADVKAPAHSTSDSSSSISHPTPISGSNTVVYCPPPQPNNIPVVHGGGSEQGTGRRPATGKGKGYSGKMQHIDYNSDGNDNGHAYEREGKYWLVPPFLIGASSIVVIYVSVHCLYMHCSCVGGGDKRRRRPAAGSQIPIRRVQIAGRSATHRGPTIVLSDLDGGSSQSRTTTSGSQLVPLVCYGDEIGGASGGRGATGSGGRAHELLEAQPFLIYEQCDDSLDYYEEQPSTSRKGSGFLQLPAAIGRRLSQARLSFSSMGRGSSRRDREPRASLCFVPVTRAISDPSGVPGDDANCASGQTRFEAYYCRSCGAHNVVEVGGLAVVHRQSSAAHVPVTLTSPDGNASTTGDESSPIETDVGPLVGGRQSSDPLVGGRQSSDPHVGGRQSSNPLVGGRQSSSFELQLTTARQVPTILVEDDTGTERSATESCFDQSVIVAVDDDDGDVNDEKKDDLASVVCVRT